MVMLHEFILTADRVVAFEAGFDRESQTASTLPFYKDRLHHLWTDTDTAYHEFLTANSEAADSEEVRADVAAVEEKFATVFTVYARFMGRMNDLINQLQSQAAPTVVTPKPAPPSVPSVPSGAPPLQNNVSAIGAPPFSPNPLLLNDFATSTFRHHPDDHMNSFKVPPCKITDFSGDHGSWPTFRDLFTAMFINNSRLSNVERLFHLVHHTKGEAHDIVAKVPLTNAGFTTAWQQLKATYDNKRLLMSEQMTLLHNLPIVTQESESSIVQLQRGINNCLATIAHHDLSITNWDPFLVFQCCQRLPKATVELWEQRVCNQRDVVTWNELNTFLTERANTLKSIASTRETSLSIPKSKPNTVAPKFHHTHVATQKKGTAPSTPKHDTISCPICNKPKHGIRSCPDFRSLSIQNRWNKIKSLNLCFNCLKNDHSVNKCSSMFSCSMCQERHHSMLHNAKGQANTYLTSVSSSQSSNDSTNCPLPSAHAVAVQPTQAAQSVNLLPARQVSPQYQLFHQQLTNTSTLLPATNCIILGTANVLLHHAGTTFPVRALIDSGSKVTCISKNVRNRLRLPVRTTNISLLGVNSQLTAQASQMCPIQIGPLHDLQTKFAVSALVLPRISSNLPSVSVDIMPHQLPNLMLADVNFFKKGPIDLLIGADLYASIILPGIHHNICRSLLAQETVFGWILTGKLPAKQDFRQSASVHFTTAMGDAQLRKFWELEEVPQKTYLTPAEKYCENLYRSTTKRSPEGRYIVTLPFKEEFLSERALGDSRNSVASIYRRNEASLMKKPDLKVTYDAVLSEYLNLGHMEKVPRPHNQETVFYLPHHPVFKPESTTTAVRVVFNASHATSNGRSLNDVLHPGPALQADLTTTLLKWRMFPFVFSSDITKMYRQILVDPRQTSFQRILFRTSPHEELTDYELNTVTFGVNCAPFLAIRTLLQLASDIHTTHPLAAKILRNNMYVDDVLAGYNDIATALRARNELTAALRSAGFELRKWSANTKELLQGIPPDHLLDQNFLIFEESSSSKALGVRWNAVRDDFYFNVQPIAWKDTFTKREVLSVIAKLFDPAGWLAPIVVVAKIIMQQIWLDGTEWDANLKADTLISWKQFIESYGLVSEIKIPRWIGLNGREKVEIHGFCDASEKAYAGVIYLRSFNNGEYRCHLLMAKTKVAPIKTITVPRPELCGALLLAHMISHVLSELAILHYELFCWTDSTIVLAWLQKPPCAWKTFVASRVSKIQDSVGIACWRHIRGTENPADLGSRGTTSSDFVTNSLWWQGPSWLESDSAQWPKSDLVTLMTNEEQKPMKTFVTTNCSSVEEILERFSSYAKALRVISYVLRFVSATKNRDFADSSEVSNQEIKRTRLKIIQLVQKVTFTTDYQLLSQRVPIRSKSELASLNPILDEDGIIRVNGRLTNCTSLSFSEKFPIILPYQSRFSRLLVHFLHDVTIHGGNKLVLRCLRQEFWIPKAQNLIKAIIHSCKTCVLFKQNQQVQLMAALPRERTSLARPFSTTGVDFAGPFNIKNYTGRACLITKGYVCIFVCFATKAIHLDVTNNLTTDCFLAAFARFVSRRGCPNTMYSDNGTTFVGAATCLAREYQQVVKKSALLAQRQYAHLNLSWKFIPAGAPHMGGLWEAGVKSFKLHFRKFASDYKYTFEEMSTLLCRIEACLNSRPLCLEPSSPNFSALTPGHFLIGAPLISCAEELSTASPASIVNRWHKLKALSQVIASRWKEEYLKELHKRVKWQFPSRNLQVNDIVVIRHENLPPTEWRLGRVCQLHPGNDGHVRVATLQTQMGTVTRPISKLVILPSEELH